jgi:hypothetical protein
MIKEQDIVRLKSNKDYKGKVTRIKRNVIWIDGKISGFLIDKWEKI